MGIERLIPPPGGDRGRQALLALLIAISLAADFLMMLAPARIPLQPIVYLPLLLGAIGCTLAQGCLLAAWLAWGDQPFGQRLLQHWIVAAVLYLVWVMGLAIAQPQEFRSLSLMVGLSVPLISIAAQLPCWIVRHFLGWRLVRGPESDAPGAAPLSIRDLMTATVVVALALALARWAPNPDGKPIGMLWVIMFAAATIISTITLLPVSLPLLRMAPFAHGALWACLYAAFWLGFAWLIVVVAWAWGLFQPPPIAVLIGFSVFVLSFAATTILAAATARAHGYRLVTSRRPNCRESIRPNAAH